MHLTQEQHNWLTLALIPGVGTTQFIRLLARFHTPTEILNARFAELQDTVGKALAQRITQYAEVVDIEKQLRLMEEYDVTLTTLDDPDYPIALAEIYDPPLALFCRGALHQRDHYAIALVGTRRASPYGMRMAETLGRELALAGITVISGMASGIDTAAHRGALEAGGRTIAVLGCGVNVVYPKPNAELMSQITENGCVLSQFPMDSPPTATHFPVRNRIISGMSLGTVVVQSPIKSGALITAHTALEQGREVFAVPGEIGVHNSAGPHSLIRDGAKLVESAADILAEFTIPEGLMLHAQTLPPPSAKAVSPPPTPPKNVVPMPLKSAPTAPQVVPKSKSTHCSDVERDILSVLNSNGSYVDEIAAACRISVAEALSTLTILELKGWVRQYSGKRFAPR